MRQSGTPKIEEIYMAAAPLAYCLLALSVALAEDVAAQSHCDPNVPTNDSTAIGYHDRGDRCEGKYATRAVGAADVVLLAFDAAEQQITPGTPAVVRWAAAGAPAQLTAQSFRRNILYRMDRRVARGEREFRWDTTIAAQANLHTSEVGLVLTSQRVIAGQPEIVYWPVSANAPAATQPKIRRVQLRLGLDFESLKWQLSTYSAGEREIEKPSGWVPLLIPLRKGDVVPLDLSLQAGRCHLLEVSGMDAERHPAGKEFYLCV
jgi:hypothetical protein